MQLKKLLEHFTEVKQLMTMSLVRICKKECFEMSLEDRQGRWWRFEVSRCFVVCHCADYYLSQRENVFTPFGLKWDNVAALGTKTRH